MSCSDHPTSVLTDTLETGARQIDSTFAEAGERLGAGLPLFDSLKERFSTLSRELTGEDFGRARATLGGLASDLRRLGQNLSGEIGKLQDLATHDAVVSQALERLIRQMRLIMILTRGARIEAVSIASRRPTEWVVGLDLDEAVRLAEAVFEVNADFFIRRLLPSLTETATRIGTRMPGAMRSSV